jgi:hypothetical protein
MANYEMCQYKLENESVIFPQQNHDTILINIMSFWFLEDRIVKIFNADSNEVMHRLLIIAYS